MTDNPVLQKLLEDTPPLPNIDGYMWLNVLIKFNTRTGESAIVRSFAKPAEMSKIKHMIKAVKKSPALKIEQVADGESLF